MSKARQPSLFGDDPGSAETAGPSARSTHSDTPVPDQPKERIPLAERMRPASVDEIVGHAKLVGPGSFLGNMLRGQTPPRSLLIWGPPGSGKTTIARLLAGTAGYAFVSLSAVLGGIKDLRDILAEARDRRRLSGKGTILFVDEIHRFNKAQQDAFPPRRARGADRRRCRRCDRPGAG
jgi:putative ATPase